MPPSQLKRLKASLREQGIVGPQKSKKQKKQIAQNGGDKDKRVNRNAALSGIREQFNPFEVKTSARGPKFEVTSNKTMNGRITKSVKARPGVTKGLGEENRRRTLLLEMQRRNKVGGILDKRFGEDDPNMTPEEKMLERFTQEKTRRHKNTAAFDLEDDDGAGISLTHMGQSLSLDGPSLRDDFDEVGLELSDAEDHASDDEKRKRRRTSDSEDAEQDDDDDEAGKPERKKTKQEVMKEVIAKSKLHKYERQAVKDDDEDMREDLDKEMSGVHALLRGLAPKPKPAVRPVDSFLSMNPERAALLDGDEKAKFNKEYDMRLKQLAQDKKSQPTERTKTEEEQIVDNSRRLQEFETARLRRMRGEVISDDEAEPKSKPKSADVDEFAEEVEEDEDYGLGSGIQTKKARLTAEELGFDDEDDFDIDADLVASGEDVDESDGGSDSESESEVGIEDDEEDGDFTGGLLSREEAVRPEFLTGANAPFPEIELPDTNGVNGDLAYTFSCPESHEQLLRITASIDVLDLPVVVQRIRALYHPKLNSENKTRLANFAVSLVDHISFLANRSPPAPFSIIETLIRHIHSLAKVYPVEIANTARLHLRAIHEKRPLALTRGDLVILTAIGSIFPTSDHFHQVVTPAMLTIGRYLGQKIPRTLSEYVTGIYLVTLTLKYQDLSKRFVPEVIGCILNTLCVLAPAKLKKIPGNFAYHESKVDYHIRNSTSMNPRNLSILDVEAATEDPAVRVSLVQTSVKLLRAAADLWQDQCAFAEIFGPVLEVGKHFLSRNCESHLPVVLKNTIQSTMLHLQTLLQRAHKIRRPLTLHNHRPLAIKTSIPKFEESFNPDKHYDADRERAEASKLKAEYKKERKGALRELRKDANFIARESLREKKVKDAAYERKYKRLVAEIQGEEGRESKVYEREKKARKGRK